VVVKEIAVVVEVVDAVVEVVDADVVEVVGKAQPELLQQHMRWKSVANASHMDAFPDVSK
jgi:hypothetical protein